MRMVTVAEEQPPLEEEAQTNLGLMLGILVPAVFLVVVGVGVAYWTCARRRAARAPLNNSELTCGFPATPEQPGGFLWPLRHHDRICLSLGF